MMRAKMFIVALAFSAIACNGFTANPTSVPTESAQSPTTASGDGSTPKVVIEAPANNSQAVVNQPLTLRVHATDAVGVTRVEMRQNGRIVINQPSPDPNPDLVALMQYRPTNTGALTLEVVAYRQLVASPAMTVTISVVGSASQLANPQALDPTLGVAAGAVCTLQVNISGLALRKGPGVNYPLLKYLSVGEALTVTGRNGDSTWYQVRRVAPAGDQAGWVNSGYVTPTGDCSRAPETTPAP